MRVNISTLIGMRLRKVAPANIIRPLISATKAGLDLDIGQGVMIYAPFFHRDEARLPEADRFAPEPWLQRRDNTDYPLIPFSGGPAMCPGRNLVLLASSTMLAALLDGRDARLLSGAALDPARPLPAMLNNYGLRFALTERDAEPALPRGGCGGAWPLRASPSQWHQSRQVTHTRRARTLGCATA